MKAWQQLFGTTGTVGTELGGQRYKPKKGGTRILSGWLVLRHQGNQSKWRLAHKNGREEDSEGKMGPKLSGADRGASVAQDRRRCQDGGESV